MTKININEGFPPISNVSIPKDMEILAIFDDYLTNLRFHLSSEEKLRFLEKYYSDFVISGLDLNGNQTLDDELSDFYGRNLDSRFRQLPLSELRYSYSLLFHMLIKKYIKIEEVLSIIDSLISTNVCHYEVEQFYLYFFDEIDAHIARNKDNVEECSALANKFLPFEKTNARIMKTELTFDERNYIRLHKIHPHSIRNFIREDNVDALIKFETDKVSSQKEKWSWDLPMIEYDKKVFPLEITYVRTALECATKFKAHKCMKYLLSSPHENGLNIPRCFPTAQCYGNLFSKNDVEGLELFDAFLKETKEKAIEKKNDSLLSQINELEEDLKGENLIPNVILSNNAQLFDNYINKSIHVDKQNPETILKGITTAFNGTNNTRFFIYCFSVLNLPITSATKIRTQFIPFVPLLIAQKETSSDESKDRSAPPLVTFKNVALNLHMQSAKTIVEIMQCAPSLKKNVLCKCRDLDTIVYLVSKGAAVSEKFVNETLPLFNITVDEINTMAKAFANDAQPQISKISSSSVA